MVADFKEEYDGQLSFLEEEKFDKENKKYLSPFLKLIFFSRREYRRLNRAIEVYENIKIEEQTKILHASLLKDFNAFIDEFFQQFHAIDLQDAMDQYKDYSTDYHNVGKLFLYYLQNFIYSNDLTSNLDNARIIRIENFIEADPVSYRLTYKDTILKMKNRQKLRVNNYIIYNIVPFLKQLEELEQITVDVNKKFKSILEDHTLKEAIFDERDKNVINKENKGVLSMLFLHYLEKYVYSARDKEISQAYLAKIENYVVIHFSNTFQLSKKQERAYEKAKEQVSKRLCTYIEQKYVEFNKMLHDYDESVAFQKSGKIQMIEIHDDLKELPVIYSEADVKFALETFINTIFMLSENFTEKNLPIYSENTENCRFKAMEIALEYLWRFVYKKAKYHLIDDKNIITLEEYIAKETNFHVEKPDLCVAKSILLDRANRNNASALVQARLKKYCQ